VSDALIFTELNCLTNSGFSRCGGNIVVSKQACRSRGRINPPPQKPDEYVTLGAIQLTKNHMPLHQIDPKVMPAFHRTTHCWVHVCPLLVVPHLLVATTGFGQHVLSIARFAGRSIQPTPSTWIYRDSALICRRHVCMYTDRACLHRPLGLQGESCHRGGEGRFSRRGGAAGRELCSSQKASILENRPRRQ
jgi:hypothetical protein